MQPAGEPHQSKGWEGDRETDLTAETDIGRFGLKHLGRTAGVTGLSPHTQLPQRGTVCQRPEASGQRKGVIPEPKADPHSSFWGPGNDK